MNNNPQILELKIPLQLATQTLAQRNDVTDGRYIKKTDRVYQTNRHLKAITTFIILKAVTPYGLIKSYQKQIDYLCAVTQCERQTLKKRLQFLQDQKLLTIEGADVRLCGWKQVAALYYTNLKQFKTVFYDYTKDKNIFLRLFASEIEANKEQQTYMIQEKLKRNPTLKNRIQAAVLQHGGDVKRINEFNYLHNAMRKLFKYSFIAEPELHALLINVRPDCNRSVHTIADAWHFKKAQLVSYYKRLFALNEIAVIHKGERITSNCRVRNKPGHVIWNDRTKKTVLALVDTISIISKNVAA